MLRSRSMNFVDILSPACALFLDFDGTLVDIAPEPGAVVVPCGLVPTLDAGCSDYLGGAVAVISGRPIHEIDEFLRPAAPARGRRAWRRAPRAPTATSTCCRASRWSWSSARPRDARARAPGTAGRTQARLARAALPRRRRDLEAAVPATRCSKPSTQSPGLALLRGKMVVEAKPGGASKGSAIEAFLREPPFAGRTPLFVGDDVTDEAGFSTVQRLGGLGVKVGEGADRRLATAAASRRAAPRIRTSGGQGGRREHRHESQHLGPEPQPRRHRQLRLQRAGRRARQHRLVLPAALRRRPGVQRPARPERERQPCGPSSWRTSRAASSEYEPNTAVLRTRLYDRAGPGHRDHRLRAALLEPRPHLPAADAGAPRARCWAARRACACVLRPRFDWGREPARGHARQHPHPLRRRRSRRCA